MGCFGDREQYGSATNEQTWDYLILSDFKSTSCWSPFSYGIVYILLVISVAVYIVDIYTASNLLFFDRWSSQVKPWIPFEVSRWVFAGCIILSWILLAYRMWRAIRAMRTGVITASYLDPLAVRIESVRPGKARGWRRFLVFGALTKGRKGSEYVALFTYFSFEAWLRIVFAEGPRQVINALTLYSVLKAKLIPVGQHAPNEGHTSVAQFFINVKILANDNTQQATILFGMLYVLIVWIFSALSLFVAFLMYITFLWHHIPSADGSLTQYCRRKIEKRLNQIVRKKVDKAIAKDYKDRVNRVATGGVGASVGAPASNLDLDYKRQPTLPNLDTNTEIPSAPLSRQTTGTAFESRPASPFGFRPAAPFIERPSSPRPSALSGSTKHEPTIPDFAGANGRPDAPSRSGTQSSMQSNTSYGSDAPLMGGAAEMGYRPPNRQSPPGRPPRMESERSASSSRGPPPRGFSAMSQHTQRSVSAGQSRMGLPPRQSSAVGSRSMTPMSGSTQGPGRHPMSRDPSAASTSSQQRRPLPGASGLSRRPTQEYEMQSPTSSSVKPPPLPSGHGSSYAPFKPTFASQQRNFTQPQQQQQQQRALPPTDYFGETHVPQRVGTAPAAQSVGMYDDTIYDAYGASNPPPGQQAFVPFRPATAGPGPRPGAATGRRMNSNDGMRAAPSPYRPPNF